MTKASFIKKKRDAEWRAESLRLEKEMERQGRESGYMKTRISIRRWPLKWKNINKTKSFIISRQQNTVRSINMVTEKTLEYRTFTAAFLEKAMTRNYNVHLDKRHEQIQLNLKLQTQRKQLRITKWGRCFAS